MLVYLLVTAQLSIYNAKFLSFILRGAMESAAALKKVPLLFLLL
jgi:hypothetical protein